MALLYRFVQVPDRARSHLFTFIVTRSVTRDIDRDVTSKEFVCGHHRWAITFSRTDKTLGVYLVWRNPSDQMRVYVDFTFTLLNREHFSINEGFSGKQIFGSVGTGQWVNFRSGKWQHWPGLIPGTPANRDVKFTLDCPAQGNRNYIPVSDIYTRNFADANGEFQLELCLGHIRTVFDTEFRIPPSLRILNPNQPVTPSKRTKLESNYFSFGGFDWNLALYPHGVKDSVAEPRRGRKQDCESRLALYLNRCTGFDHQCRVRYEAVLGDGDKRIDSGVVDDVSDSDGKSYGWHPRSRYADVVYKVFMVKGTIRVHLEMLIANTLSEVVANVRSYQMPGSSLIGVTAEGDSLCYDREKMAWTVRVDCQSSCIRVHMIYKEIHNIPRNHLRYVAWTAYILRFKGKNQEPQVLPGAPFSRYYVQESVDEGIIMDTDISINELRDPDCPYVNANGQIRIQIEWIDNYLLFQATYHKYDDISRMQNHQMRKEICALQSENYSLERQLFCYQKSIGNDELVSPDGEEAAGLAPKGRPADEQEDDEYDKYYEDRSYSLGERTESTDTEWA